MRTSITTNHREYKEFLGNFVVNSESDCHYTFRAGEGLLCTNGLENKAFSRAAAVGLGEFTPNIG
jgi:hypothetical protein